MKVTCWEPVVGILLVACAIALALCYLAIGVQFGTLLLCTVHSCKDSFHAHSYLTINMHHFLQCGTLLVYTLLYNAIVHGSVSLAIAAGCVFAVAHARIIYEGSHFAISTK